MTAANSGPQQKLLSGSFWCHMDGPCDSMWTWMLVMIVIFYYDQWRDAFIWRTDQSSVEQWSWLELLQVFVASTQKVLMSMLQGRHKVNITESSGKGLCPSSR